MAIAKVFENGRSQAVRIPKEYRFDCSEVIVNKIGEVLIMTPKDKQWDGLLASLDQFSDDFMSERNQMPAQERESL